MSLREPKQNPEAVAQLAARELDRLEVDLRKLQIDFERYFNGALPLPPEDQRQQLQDRLRQLRETQSLGSVERFRASGLEARFNTYSELFHRRVRDREEGRIAASASPSPEQRPKHDPRQGVVIGQRIEAEAVEALYVGLCKGPGAPNFDLESFRVYIERQVDSIRQKTQCKQVRFRLEEADGKVRLKARPMKEDEAHA